MMKRSLFSTSSLLALLLFTPQQVMAASSEWRDIGGGQARLIAVKDPQTNAISGAVEVRLDEGWKTYWKSPGGSGIAPEFDFSRSTDFFVGPVSFPVPEWIVLPDASFYGYKNSIAFPFSADGGNGTAIKLDMLIGVCEEICIPAIAGFELSADALNRSDPKTSVQLSLAQSTLPRDLAADMPQIANSLQMKQDGDSISVSGNLPLDDATYRVVLEATGRWVSDPVEPVMDGGQFVAGIRLPKQVAAAKKLEDWRIYLIGHAPDNGGVSAVFKADLVSAK